MNKFYRDVAGKVLNQVSLESLRGANVLLTGANGLLGSHMLSVLAHANDELGLNIRATAVSRNSPVSWCESLFRAGSFKFEKLNLVGADLSSFHRGEYTHVIHAATYGQPKKFLENAKDTMLLNTAVTQGLLEVAEKTNGHFLFMSSSEIYGDAPKEAGPLREDYPGNVSPTDQRSPYTSSKRLGETWCKVYEDSKKVRARIARVSSAYGPGVYLNDDRVLNVFIRRAIESGELKMMDRGEQRRRWLYISDAVVMLFHILLHGKHLVYNVAGEDLRSIRELASYISQGLDVPLLMPEESGVAEHTKGAPNMIDIDIQRIKAEAGLTKLVPLSEGIQSCIQWNHELLAEAVS